MRQVLAVAAWVVFGLGYSTLGVAQTTNPATDQRIHDLEARVAALERLQGMRPAATAVASSPPASVSAQPTMAPMPTPKSAPTAADWGSLHRGMTSNQVTALLGKPGDTRVLPMSSTWYYPDIHGRRIEFDRNGRVEQWSQP